MPRNDLQLWQHRTSGTRCWEYEKPSADWFMVPIIRTDEKPEMDRLKQARLRGSTATWKPVAKEVPTQLLDDEPAIETASGSTIIPILVLLLIAGLMLALMHFTARTRMSNAGAGIAQDARTLTIPVRIAPRVVPKAQGAKLRKGASPRSMADLVTSGGPGLP